MEIVTNNNKSVEIVKSGLVFLLHSSFCVKYLYINLTTVIETLRNELFSWRLKMM